MIEEIILDYLKEKGFNAYMEKPFDSPSEYLLIEKTGSDLENHIYSATFTIQSYAPSMYEAAKLNTEIIAEMLAITDTEDISKCSLNSDYNFTDTTTKEYRYQAVFDIVY